MSTTIERRPHDLPKVSPNCCCGRNGHPAPCFSCRAANDLCECCGAPGTSFAPYGVYCEPCGADICHPTGFGWCINVDNGREHRSARPDDWWERLTPKEQREMDPDHDPPRKP